MSLPKKLILLVMLLISNSVIANKENLFLTLLFERNHKLNILSRETELFDGNKSVLNTISLIHQRLEEELRGDVDKILQCSDILSSYINCYLAFEIYIESTQFYGSLSSSSKEAMRALVKYYKKTSSLVDSRHKCSIRKGTFVAIYYDYLKVLNSYEKYKE